MSWHFEYEGRDVTEYVMGFCEAMFFSDCATGIDSSEFWDDENQEDIREGLADGCLPSDAGMVHLNKEAIAAITKFCGEFVRNNEALLEAALERTDEESIGRDLYLVRAGHGVGFTDRDELSASDDDTEEYEALTETMRATYETDTNAWREALSKRNAIEARGLAQRLEAATGRGEISTSAYETDSEGHDGFAVEVYLG